MGKGYRVIMIYLLGCVIGFITTNLAQLMVDGELEVVTVVKSIPLAIFSWLTVIAGVCVILLALFELFCRFVDSFTE